MIIDFSLVAKESKMSLPHKITNVPNSQNTLQKKLFLLKSLIGYSLGISFEWQEENMQIPFWFWLMSLPAQNHPTTILQYYITAVIQNRS